MKKFGFDEEYHLWWRQVPYVDPGISPTVETVACGVLLPNGQWAIEQVSSRQSAMDDFPDLADCAVMRCQGCGAAERHDDECVHQDRTWDFGVAAYVGAEFT